MDKKSIIGLVLIFLVFVGYMFWIRPSEEEIAERMRQDSVRRVELMRADSIANADAEGCMPAASSPMGVAPAIASLPQRSAAIHTLSSLMWVG